MFGRAATLVPEATLTQITNDLKSAFDWLNAEAGEHGIRGPIIVTGWSASGRHPSTIASNFGASLRTCA